MLLDLSEPTRIILNGRSYVAPYELWQVRRQLIMLGVPESRLQGEIETEELNKYPGVSISVEGPYV